MNDYLDSLRSHYDHVGTSESVNIPEPMSKNIVTESGAKYSVTTDGAVTRERGETNISNTHANRQYTKGYLITDYDSIREDVSFMWYGVEGDVADIIKTSTIVSVEEKVA